MRLLRLFCLLALLGPLPVGSAMAESPLARRVPGRPLVYLEAADFAGLLDRLEGSSGMAAWYASASYEGFLETKLARKLADRFRELESLIGLGVSRKNLRTVAGSESAIALYDIGKLEFLYLSRMASGAFTASALAELRSRFDERRDGDLTYFAREREDGGLAFAFVFTGDLLLVSTRVGLLELAMRLPTDVAAEGSLAAEEAHAAAVRGAAPDADLRLWLDQERLTRDGYFRTYWMFDNPGDLEWMGTAYLTARFTTEAVVEERCFLPRRAAAGEAVASPVSTLDPGLASLGRRLARGVHHVALRASPSTTEALGALVEELAGPPGRGEDRRAELVLGLERALSGETPSAMARVVDSGADASGYYLSVSRAVVLSGVADSPALLSRLEAPLGAWLSRELTGETSTPGLGFETDGSLRSFEIPFGGGRGIHFATAPWGLVAATHPELARRLLSPDGGPAAAPISLPERPLTSLLITDLARARATFRELASRATSPQDPLRRYFSGNWGGLLQSFSGVRSLTASTWAEKGLVRQTVRYDYDPSP